jgi:hypothetical protein
MERFFRNRSCCNAAAIQTKQKPRQSNCPGSRAFKQNAEAVRPANPTQANGTLSPLHDVGPDQLRTRTLLTRAAQGEIDEVILATSPTLEGEATASWLAAQLHAQPLHHSVPIRITRIATGVPAGSDIEYADEVTMARAMEGRRDL